MTSRAAIERFPFELIEEISQYLSVEDLTSCSAVSRGWREAFNYDRLWKPHCEPRLEAPLRSTVCVVQPAFTIPGSSKGSLSGLCEWRLAFMRQCHLFNNWRHGRFQKKRILVDRNEDGYDRVFYYGFITNDKLLMVVEERIDLWDFSVDPYKKVAETFYCQPQLHSRPTHISVSENLITISSDSFDVIQVFCVDLILNKIALAHVFKIQGKVKFPDSDIDMVRKVIDSQDSFTFSNWVVLGSLFFGYTGCRSDWNVFHIWDIQAGKKLKEELFPKVNSGVFIGFITHTTCEDLVIIKETTVGGKLFHMYYVYSTKQCTLLPFSKTVGPHTYQGMSVVLFKFLALKSASDTFSIFNYETDQLLMTIKNSCYVKILNNNFVFKVCECGITSEICSLSICNPSKKTLIKVLDRECSDFVAVGQKFIATIEYDAVVWTIGKEVEKTSTTISDDFKANELCILLVTQKEWEDLDVMIVYRFW